MAIAFHLVRFRSVCQLSKKILHIDSCFHTLTPITFNETEPRGIPYAPSEVADLPH